MKFFTNLDWHNGPWPGFGDVYVNGRKSDQGYHRIVTVFGFGFGIYNPWDGKGWKLAVADRIAYGFIRFVPRSKKTA